MPDTTVHAPTPTVGLLAARVVLVSPHKFNWSGPAAAVVGLSGNEITTSSVDAEQGELLMVQRNVFVLPAAAVNVVVALMFEPKVPPLPEKTDHVPVPEVGVLAARLVTVTPQTVWSGPAADVVGSGTTVTAAEPFMVAVHPDKLVATTV